MSNDQRLQMSPAEAKKQDDITIALISRALRLGQPFILGQGGNGRVVHVSGQHVSIFVDDLFYKLHPAHCK